VDYEFQDGSKVKKGDWVCIPQGAMMRDASRFSSPHQFDGFRFFHANRDMVHGQLTSAVPDKQPSWLTTSKEEWPIWGLGKTAW
jgi:hypothetical protein